MKTNTSNAWNGISTNLSNTMNSVKSSAQTFGENVNKTLTSKFSTLKSDTYTLWSGMSSQMSTVMESTKNAAKNFGDAVKSTVDSNFNTLKSNVSTTWSGISTKLSAEMKSIKGFASNFGDEVKSALTNSFNALKSNLSNTWSLIKDSLKNTWGGLETSASNIFGGISTTISNALSSAKGTISGMQSEFNGAVSSARSAASDVESAFNRIDIPHIPLPHFSISSSQHSVGGITFSLPSIGVNWYKAGGLFQDAHVIGVGESGAEAVLPLESSKAMSKIADSILSNAPDAGYRAEDLRDAVAQGVALAMMNNQGNNSAPEYIQNSIYLDGDVIARSVSKAQRDTDRRYNPTPRYGY